MDENQREEIKHFMYENYELREIISDTKREYITDKYKINLRNKDDEDDE